MLKKWAFLSLFAVSLVTIVFAIDSKTRSKSDSKIYVISAKNAYLTNDLSGNYVLTLDEVSMHMNVVPVAPLSNADVLSTGKFFYDWSRKKNIFSRSHITGVIVRSESKKSKLLLIGSPKFMPINNKVMMYVLPKERIEVEWIEKDLGEVTLILESNSFSIEELKKPKNIEY